MAMDGDRLAMIDCVGVEAVLGMWPLPTRRGLWQGTLAEHGPFG